MSKSKYRAPRGAALLTTREQRPPSQPISNEAAAARELQQERDRRASAALAEVLAAMRRHGCGFQVIVQDLMVPGQPGSDRRCQVNVVALDPPATEATVFDAAPAAPNGKPAP